MAEEWNDFMIRYGYGKRGRGMDGWYDGTPRTFYWWIRYNSLYQQMIDDLIYRSTSTKWPTYHWPALLSACSFCLLVTHQVVVDHHSPPMCSASNIQFVGEWVSECASG